MTPDPTPYGRPLAEAVADALLAGHEVAHAHRDYCGPGLAARGGALVYGEVWDGWLTGGRTFPDRAGFVGWLAAQSDHSLYGFDDPDPWRVGNQRVTRRRLEAAVRRWVSGAGGI